MFDEENAADRSESDGGRKQRWLGSQVDTLMSPKIQRAARTWLLPVTLIVVSPLILGAAWKRWRKK